MEVGVEKEMEEKKTETFEKEKEKKNEKEKEEAKKKGKKVVEDVVKPVTKSTRTSQRVQNMKVLNFPLLDTDESFEEEEVKVIVKEDYESNLPYSREQNPVPMETIPPFPPSPQKSASPSHIAPQINPLPPSTSKPSCSVPIPEEQPGVPKSKEHTAAPNPSQNAPSSSRNPSIGSTYTLAHVRRLDYLFSLVMVIKGRANLDDDEDDDEYEDVEEEEKEMEVGVEKEMEEKKTETFEKEKEKKNEKEKEEAKKKGKKVVEDVVKPVTKSTRTSQRVQNMKVLNFPLLDTDESFEEEEVKVIVKEDYESNLPYSREQNPVPMETIPPFPPSPQKSASPSHIAPQINPLPPSTSKPSCSVPIPEEQPGVPKSKEHTAAPNPSQNAPSSSRNPSIGSTYTLAHVRRLDYLFSLVMGHSEAMMEFATETKDLNGLVKGVMNKVDKALEGQQVIMERLGELSSSIQVMNSRLLKLEDDVLKSDHTMAENHKEVMAKLINDVVEEIEQPPSPNP
ncbi:hypothetical protein BVRB_2g037710 [Beta vulgaris subsp. vulgaris]|nr:hypothetical protein BVRB_2g037710 [Beta vulgaris subsp. vulgaris]